jgi:hypothetical protein
MPTDVFYRERGRYGSLLRSREADDPELIAAKNLMLEEALVEAVRRAMLKAPAMTDAVRQRVIGLLS